MDWLEMLSTLSNDLMKIDASATLFASVFFLCAAGALLSESMPRSPWDPWSLKRKTTAKLLNNINKLVQTM